VLSDMKAIMSPTYVTGAITGNNKVSEVISKSQQRFRRYILD